MKANDGLTFPCGNFSADRWGNTWSKNAVNLAFGNDRSNALIALEPSTAKALCNNLQQILAAYEAFSGKLWSESAEQIGRSNDKRLFGIREWNTAPERCQFPTKNSAANRLYLQMRSLPLSGCERSFKMLDSTLLEERFLAGLACSQIALEDVEFIAAALNAPANFIAELRRQWPQAQFFHMGFEQGARDATYKLYLEFQSSEMPLYIGYKWNPEAQQQQSISHYKTLATPSTLRDALRAFYDPANAEVLRIILGILHMAEEKCRARNDVTPPLLLQVQDTESPRKSFDLNLYESELRIAELAPLLTQLGMHFKVSQEKSENLLKRTGNDLLGHLSGGIDRNGNAFLTIYHAPVTDQDKVA